MINQELYKIEDDTVIIMADTHLGSIYENIVYTYQIYEYAYKIGVRKIYVVGDFLQGLFPNVRPKFASDEAQISHVIEDYPFDKTIQTYIMGGNHDYPLFIRHPDFLGLFEERKDLKFIGIKKCYLDWNGAQIALTHSCPKYSNKVISRYCDMDFRGHSHRFKNVKNFAISVPTASDDMKFDCPPGFLIVSVNDGIIYVEQASFNPILEEPKLILQKNTLARTRRINLS